MALQTRPASQSASAPAAPPPPEVRPLTFRQWLAASLLGCVFLGFTALAVRYVELVTGRYVASGVPPVPAVAALLVLVALRPLLRRVPPPLGPHLQLDRRQILLVFSMVCVGAILNGQYTVRAFFPHLVAMQYWQTHNMSALARWSEYIPAWYAPVDTEAIRQYWDGARGSGVPWNLWLLPLLRWSCFFAAVALFGSALVALLRRQWLHYERLSFPLLYLPLSVTAEGGSGLSPDRPLFQQPLLWVGAAIALVFNAFNIGHALNPAIPAPGFSYSLRGLFPNPPWTPFNSISLFYMLEAIGIGYFLPLEVSFSTWFFYLAVKLVGVFGIAAGYEAPGFPYIQDQCAGAYLGTAALLLFGARKHLAGILRRSVGLSPMTGAEGEQEEQSALFVLIGSAVFILGWAWFAGFSLAVALPFFTILACFVLVYARLRAETGAPFAFLYPYGLPKEMLVNALTPRGILDIGGNRSWVAFSSFAWLSRHHYGEEMAAYSADGLKLSEEAKIGRRWMYGALAVAFVVGLGLAFWTHLDAFYAQGANMSGGFRMEYRADVARQEFQRMATLATTVAPRDDAKLAAQVLGGVFALFLGILRTLWVRSPFHPLGYIIATAYGDGNTAIFPMFMAWFCKSTVLKVGGLPLYRRCMPLFLGLAIGHYFVAGVFWPGLCLFLPPEVRNAYHTFFGG